MRKQRFGLVLYFWTGWLVFFSFQVTEKIMEYPVDKSNSTEFLTEFYNLENFLGWNGNII